MKILGLGVSHPNYLCQAASTAIPFPPLRRDPILEMESEMPVPANYQTRLDQKAYVLLPLIVEALNH